MSNLSAGAPLELGAEPVGRSSGLLIDTARADRMLPFEVWYPIEVSAAVTPSVYELLPGTGFTAAGAFDAPPTPGKYPLVIFSHGRTGTRIAYTLLCEAMAALGAVVVSADHPGDTLIDWALEAAADDETNEMSRVADARLILDAAFGTIPGMPDDVRAVIDTTRVAVGGHSYGGYTALAIAAGAHGVVDARITAAFGLQAYTRALTDSDLASIRVPLLLSVATRDVTTPAALDADRPWRLISAPGSWRVDVGDAAHQACSDVGLYAELAPQVPDLPETLRVYLEETAAETRAEGMRGWRESVRLQAQIVAAFLDDALQISSERSKQTLSALANDAEVTVQRRSN